MILWDRFIAWLAKDPHPVRRRPKAVRIKKLEAICC